MSVPRSYIIRWFSFFIAFSSVFIGLLGGPDWVSPVSRTIVVGILNANGSIPGAFTVLEDLYNTETKTWNLGVEHILRQQDFWFAVGMTTL